MSKAKILTVGALAPEFELVAGRAAGHANTRANPAADGTAHTSAGGENPTVVSLKERRAYGHVALYFMRAFY